MRDRLVARGVTVVAVVLLAVMSVPRLRLEYAPDVSFPELAVALHLPSTSNVSATETTRRWVIPIESAIRSVGDATGTRGDVDAGAANIVARFKRGTDIEIKAARLASELAPLRARLPERASLTIWPARSGLRPNAVFAVAGRGAADAAHRIAEELRSTPGVREVRTFGTTRDEIDVRLTTDAVGVSATEVIDGLARHPIGLARSGSRRVPVVAAPAAARIRDLPLGAVRLGSVAEIRERIAEPQSLARLNGQPAAIINVFRDDDAPLLSFDRAVRLVLSGRATTIWSDAEELRVILSRVVIALLIASLILAVGGGLPLGLYVPAAVAVAINVWRIAGTRVDAQTILVSLVAIAAVTPFAASRTVSRAVWPLVLAAGFVALLPIAATFGSGALAPLLAPPARDFATAACCALVAAFLVCRTAALGGRPPRAAALHSKNLLRNAASVVLAALTIAMLFLSWFGSQLDPRRRQGSADRSRVYVRLQLPAGSTLARTTAAARHIEQAVRGLDGVRRFWTSVEAERATVVIEVERELEQPQRFDLFQVSLRTRIPATQGTVSIQNSFDRTSASSLAETIEEQPHADASGSIYRFLLKGTDADVLRRSAEELTTRIMRGDVSRRSIASEWPAPSPRLELRPKFGMAPETADAAARELALRSLPPPVRELPRGTALRVTLRDAPLRADDVPRRGELFSRPLTIGDKTIVVEDAFHVKAATGEGGVTRELGRFVLPMMVHVHAQTLEQAIAKRVEIDRSVGVAPLPAGVIVERPRLGDWNFSVAKFRLAAVAAFLPLLIFTASAIALASIARAVIVLAPAALSLAFVAPVLAAVSAHLDEMTLLAAGGAICIVAAIAATTLIRIGERTAAGAYVVVRGYGRPIVVATIAAVAMTGIAASALPAIGDAWRAPLIASVAVLAAGVPAALLLPAAIDILWIDLRRRRSAAARAIAHPAVWGAGVTTPHLAVRNVTKIYATGFRALDRVTFDLTPGVIGLLGPNGAGKTTLLRILTGLLHQTRGTVSYCGVPVQTANVADFRRSIGFLPQEFNAYAGLTAAQFLDFWALERGIDSVQQRRTQIEDLLYAVGLDEHANRRVRDFSGGMRQRIGIARALLGDPPLLVVDEPTTGLDIDARRRFRDLLTALARNRIIILSSHIASDVETTAVRLLLLARGQLRWQGSVDGLLERARGRVFETIVSESEVRALSHEYRITTRVRVKNGVRIRGVAAEGQPLPGAAVKPSLEEAYLSEVSTGAIRRGSFAFVFAAPSS